MTAIVKTNAIVLKSMKYRDTSRIVTFYTEQFGKVRGIAKGARGAKNKFGSSLDSLARVHLVFYDKEHRDLHLVSQCDIRDSGSLRKGDLHRMAVGLACLELLDQVVHDREQNVAVFRLIDRSLELANIPLHDPNALLAAFKIQLASLMGYQPQFRSCEVCGKNPDDGDPKSWNIDLSRGAVVCGTCSTGQGFDVRLGGMKTITAPTLVCLQRLLSEALEVSTLRSLDAAVGNEVRDVLRLYLQCHFDHIRPLRSEQLLAVAEN
jgi:DNA repair protein RecO (recombination protein O)